jgi:DNA gyrase subunit A
MLITNGGTLIRINADDVSEIGRNTQGVKLLNVDDDEKVIAVVRIAEPGDEPTTAVVSNIPVSADGAAVDDDDGAGGDGGGDA